MTMTDNHAAAVHSYCQCRGGINATFNACHQTARGMGFRDLLADAEVVAESTSCIHEIFDYSKNLNNCPLLFESIKEANGHRAALNLLDRGLLCKTLGIADSELIDILAEAMANPIPTREVEDAKVLQCSMDVDLTCLPIPHHHREDGGRYMSASIIIAEYNGIRNVSFHRQLVLSKNELAARLVPRHLRTMVNEARSVGDEINIAIINGPDPLVLLAGAMSFDENLDELTVASALHQQLRGSPLPVVRLENGILVPADAEYAMQARITSRDAEEGPYVDITGTVDDIRMEPLIEVDSISHAKDPIMHVLIPGLGEHRALMGLPRAPAIKAAVSKVVDCHDVFLTEGGCGWLSSVVAISPQEKGDGVKAIHAAFAGHRSMKQVTIVNTDIDITNPVAVEWAMMTRWQPDIDTVILSGQKGSSLDPSINEDGTTAKVGFDATLSPGVSGKEFTSVL